MDELGRRIAELVQEAEANVTEAPKRTWYEATVGHPGVMTHRQKLPEQRLADLRRDYVLSRLSGEVAPRSESEYQLMRTNPGLYEAMEAYRGNKDLPHLSKESLRSPYQRTGLLGPGGGLHTANQWLQSGIGIAGSGSHMLANAAGDATAYLMSGDQKPMYGGYVKSYKDAQQDAIRSFNTLTAPVQALAGVSDVSPGYSQWSRAATARQMMADEDWTDLTGAAQARSNAIEQAAAPDPYGYELLSSYGVPEVPARMLGATMDTILNPIPPPLKAIKEASRAGRLLQAARSLALEMLPGYGVEGLAYGSQFLPKQGQPPIQDIDRIKAQDMATGLREAGYGRR